MSTHDARKILLVGGAARVALAACRGLAAAGQAAALLRWHPTRSFADFSRHCSASIWLGAVDDDVAPWLARLSGLLADHRFAAVWPLDAQAHELLCSGRWRPPPGVGLLGPTPASHALAANRLAARERAAACGLRTLPTVYLPRGSRPETIALPCVLRPERAAAVDADEPMRFAARRIETPRELDHRLRDDLPRVGLLVQPPAPGDPVHLLIAAQDGRLTFATPLQPELSPALRRLARQLRWTGMLHVELMRQGDRFVFADLHLGPTPLPDLPRAEAARAVRALLGAPTSAAVRVPGPDALPALVRAVAPLACLVDKLSIRARALGWRLHGGSAKTRSLHPGDAVLFVCKGNINRSLVAEQVLRQRGFARVASAGLIGMSGRRPSRAAEAFIEHTLGRPTGDLRSSSLRRAIARLPAIDAVICFERRHVVELLARHPQFRGRVHLLTTLAGQPHGPVDIADPHGRDDAEGRRCFERIDTLLNRASSRAAPVPALVMHPH